jgi:hypothetical protein
MAADSEVAARARAALGVLADLTPSAERRAAAAESVPLEWFRWLDTGFELLTAFTFADPGSRGPSLAELMRQADVPAPRVPVDKQFGERLAAVQQVREGRHAIRVGWLWVAGSVRWVGSDGQETRRRIFQPLVSRTVRVVHSRADLSWVLMPYGDVEITPLVTDRTTSQRLEHHVEFGGGAFRDLRELDEALLARLPKLSAFASDCAAAAGFRDLRLVLDRDQPEDLMRRNGLRIVVGLAIYTTDEPQRTTRAGSLLAWPRGALDERTAFHAVYAAMS